MRDRLLPAVILAMMVVTSPALAGGRNLENTSAEPARVAQDGTLTAALMPGLGREGRVAALPRPLSTADAILYGRIFNLQDSGQWAMADHDMAKLKDPLLKGHVLARRYLSPGYHPKYAELKAWMSEYADLPQAEAIFQLANSKGIKGFGAIKPPVRGYLKGAGIDTSDDGANWEETVYASEGGTSAGRAAKAQLRKTLKSGDPSEVASLIRRAEGQGVGGREIDEMKTLVALDHFGQGRDQEAAQWASQAAERSGEEVFASNWVAGLAKWRQGRPEQARRHFEEVAEATDAPGWMVAAGAFWAARANLVSHRPDVVDHWLEVAATYPRTFYGLLARRVLGYETMFSWGSAPFTESDSDVMTRVPGGKRALAMLQLGEKGAAEEELRKAYPRAGKALRQSMLAVAQQGEMPELAIRLGGMAPGRVNDAAAFPVPDWNPKGGWLVEKALVFAFVRQESSFNPRAKSAKGAGGLMQLMPATASSIVGTKARDHLINDPEYNLAIGQRYLQRLMAQEPVNGNLLFLAAAYNAGPGKLGQWLAGNRHNNDPLLFVETLPSRETRTFVQRVMTNYWIYRARLNQKTDSLDDIAAGVWPRYDGENLEAKALKVSSR